MSGSIFSLPSISQVGSGISNLGGAVGDLLSAGGDYASAATYEQAAKYAGQDIGYATAEQAISDMQAQRAVTGALGTQTADVAASGFANSGTAVNLMMDSSQQGALTKSLVNTQGQIQIENFKEQQSAYLGEAAAASKAGSASTIAGIAGAVGSIIGLL